MKVIQKADLMIVLYHYGDKYSFELDDFKKILDRYGDDYFLSDGRWIKTGENDDMAVLRASPAEPNIVYICDEETCEECEADNEGRCCYHTSDIHHAINFEEIAPGKFMEKNDSADDKDARIRELEKELQETRDILNRAYQVLGNMLEKPNPFEK